MEVERLLPADALRPRWSSASALVYMGGFVALFATSALLGILGDDHGDWALVGYSLLACAVALGLALALQDSGRAVAAGVLAFLAVVFFGTLVAAIENVLGILDADLGDYQPGALLIELATIVSALVALRRFRAPLLVLPIAVTLWAAVADLGSLGSWGDAGEVLSILVGAALIAAGIAVDRAGREPYGLWLHVVGGIAFGGGVLALIDGDLGWLLVGLLSLAYVGAAYRLGRSSYAVLGTIGILATTTYFTLDGFSLLGEFLPFGSGEIAEGGLDPWQVALSFVAAGLVIVLLGLIEERVTALRAREPHLQSGHEDRRPGGPGELP
jgi:hypothetical protein